MSDASINMNKNNNAGVFPQLKLAGPGISEPPPTVKDPQLEARVRALLKTLLSYAPDSPLSADTIIIEFYELSELYAGVLEIAGPLIRLSTAFNNVSDNHLATLLAHELGHYFRRHTSEKSIEKSIINYPYNLIVLITGKRQKEADEFGIRLAQDAGFKTNDLADGYDNNSWLDFSRYEYARQISDEYVNDTPLPSMYVSSKSFYVNPSFDLGKKIDEGCNLNGVLEFYLSPLESINQEEYTVQIDHVCHNAIANSIEGPLYGNITRTTLYSGLSAQADRWRLKIALEDNDESTSNSQVKEHLSRATAIELFRLQDHSIWGLGKTDSFWTGVKLIK